MVVIRVVEQLRRRRGRRRRFVHHVHSAKRERHHVTTVDACQSADGHCLRAVGPTQRPTRRCGGGGGVLRRRRIRHPLAAVGQFAVEPPDQRLHVVFERLPPRRAHRRHGRVVAALGQGGKLFLLLLLLCLLLLV